MEEEKQIGSIYEVPIDSVRPMKNQPRTYFNPDSIIKLANNIRKNGLITPLLITRNNEIVSGERRWRAAKEADLNRVPVIYKEDRFIEGDYIYQIAVIENIMREDLTSIEKAESLWKLYEQQRIEDEQLTQEKFGNCYDLKKSSISEIFAIARMPESIRNQFRNQREAAVRELKKIASAKDPEKQKSMADKYFVKLDQANKETHGDRKKPNTKEFFSKKIVSFSKSIDSLEKKWDTTLTSSEEKTAHIEMLESLRKKINSLIKQKKDELSASGKQEKSEGSEQSMA